MNKSVRFVARAVVNKGWQVWDRKLQRPWGMVQKYYPEKLLVELNNQRRGVIMDRLMQNNKPQTPY